MGTIDGFRIANLSVGGGKGENEDITVIGETAEGCIAVLCDGLGGSERGADASKTAATIIYSEISSVGEDSDPLAAMRNAAETAHNEIKRANESDAETVKAGSTCVAVSIQGSKAFVMHVGNSRCYLIRGRKATFRTADHSYVGDLTRRGSISEEMARTSAYANVLTQALGVSDTVNPETAELKIESGDRIVLMSDGLWGAMPESHLISLLSADNPLEEIIDTLKEKAAAPSGSLKDDLSVIMIECGDRESSGKTLMSISEESAAASEEYSEQPEYIYEESDAPESLPEDEGNSETEEFDEQPEDNSSKNKTLIWIISILILLAVGFLIFFFLTPKTEEVKKEAAPTEAPTDSIATVAPTDTTISVEQEINSILSEPVAEAVETPHAYAESYSAAEATDNPEAEQDEVTEIAEPQLPQNAEAKATLARAAERLMALRDFDPKEISKKDTRRRRLKRTEIFDETVAILKESMGQSEDDGFKSEIVSIGNDLTSPATKSKILKIDEETGLSTRASATTLDSFIARLQQLAE